ncbi:MAG: NAD(P)-dependent oxidoreductase [Methylomonas sp.]|nr:NAD(P)-dependent oxidoreductase [Methylomonas sp.]PPD20026.1 MAG: oxidoreductase [Methylomonas sp.]PPD25889.1 MAG: oxidoreductase [Methylomonas sp.]PPD37335.1 MAG: oxidoreductase [Methylomonas sp.]PPD40123.1 MAG: oxidoreductase [Methylomonas sp.]
MKAGFIGLGAMGQGMARNLAKAGVLAAVCNRTLAKVSALASELNVVACPDPQILAAQVDVVLICVSADQDVLDVVSAVAQTIKPGSVVIDLSTVSAQTARAAAAMLADRQAAFLDAPVSGGVEGANNGKLVMMVGGDAAVLQRVRPILGSMTSRIELMGNIGAGQACKAVNQVMAAGIAQAVTEALAFGQALGLDMDKVVDLVAGGAAGNWFLQHRGKTLMQGIFKPGFKLALHHKDLRICQQMADNVGMALPLTDVTVDDYAELMQQGHGDDDISALFRLKRTT